MKKRISDMMDCIQCADLELNQETPLSSQRIKELTMNKITNKRRTHRRAGFRVLVAAAVIAAMTLTVFAAGNMAGWFRQYFEKQTDTPLTSEQIEFIEENEQIFSECVEHNGYTLELKSILTDSSTVYVTVGLTAPADVTEEEIHSLWGSDIDIYDAKQTPCGSFCMEVYDDGDGLKNTADLLFEFNPSDGNSGNIWTLRIGALATMVWDKEYEQELLNTKYAGQENIIFSDEEAARIHWIEVLAEGPWEFTVDLSNAINETLELITTPVTTQSCYGYKPDGTEVFEDVTITSFELSALSAIIRAESPNGAALEFSDNSERLVYVVMKDGRRIQLITDWGSIGEAHMRVESPIVLAEVDYVLLADGTKIDVP